MALFLLFKDDFKIQYIVICKLVDLIEPRAESSHKRTYGHALLVAGNIGLMGHLRLLQSVFAGWNGLAYS